MQTTRLIEQYLDGSLEKEQRALFQSTIDSDHSLQKLVRLHKEINESIGNKEFFQLQQQIEIILNEQNHSATVPSKRIYLSLFLRIAAVFIFLTATTIVLKFTVFNSSSPERIFKSYYTPYDIDGVMRSGFGSREQLTLAIRNYSNGNFMEAENSLNDVLMNDPDNYVALYYKGLSCLGSGNTEKAVQSFQSIPDSWESPFLEHRNWYLALALLKKGDLQKSAGMFSQISREDGYYSIRASQILEKIKP